MALTRAAVVGCGDVSIVHLEALASMEDVALVAVCDIDPQRRDSVAARWGVPGFSDAHAMIHEVRPDVVHVATPHDQHVDLALACLEAEVHVLLEKPLAHSLKEAERLIEGSRFSTARIGVCYQNRYTVAAQEAHRLLASGSLGHVHGAWACVAWSRAADYYDARPWRGTWARAGGGVLINQAIHTVDLIQWLLGPAHQVKGSTASLKFHDTVEVEDTISAVLTHPNGITTALHATLAAAWTQPVEIQIHTDEADLLLRDGLTVRWRDGRVDHTAERAAPSGGRQYWGVAHETLIHDFYDRLGDADPFWITPEVARESLATVSEIYRQSGAPTS